MQCMGKPSFDSVHEMDGDLDFYKDALGICYAIPSAETLQQRLDLIGGSIRRRILDENTGICRQMTDDSLLFQLDSGNDSAENIGILLEQGCHFIIKRNLRKESKEGWLKMEKENSGDITHPRNGKDVYIGSDWKEVTYKAEDGTEKHATIRMGYEIIERTVDKHGQFLLVPDIEVNIWWTNTGFSDRDDLRQMSWFWNWSSCRITSCV